jgi:hypothetical protein
VELCLELLPAIGCCGEFRVPVWVKPKRPDVAVPASTPVDEDLLATGNRTANDVRAAPTEILGRSLNLAPLGCGA